MRILVADDHAIFRRGLREILIEAFPKAEVGEAADGESVLEALRGKFGWDILILDISMPGRSGIDLLKDVKQCQPRLPVLFLSAHSEDQYAMRILKAGGAGYLTKNKAPIEIAEAVRRVLGGSVYVSNTLAERMAIDLSKGTEPMRHASLSDRELEVMRMIAIGNSLKGIAHHLGISVQTVSTHRRRLLHKMQLTSNAELIHYAIENKLID